MSKDIAIHKNEKSKKKKEEKEKKKKKERGKKKQMDFSKNYFDLQPNLSVVPAP